MIETVDPPLSVLLVEDNPNDATLVETHLERGENHVLPDETEVHHEGTLEAGLTTAEHTDIDVVLLDLGLPESSGPDTFERLDDRVHDLPVVVLTGLQDEQAAVELLNRGAQDYLVKNQLTEERLVKSIRYALERQHQHERLKTTSEQLELLNRILRHDIRNELQNQLLLAHRLEERIDGDGFTELDRIREAINQIVQLTENSREYIEFVAGEEEITREPTRLDEIIEPVLEKARSSNEDAEFSVAGSVPDVSVHANQMLSSVFRNLLSNAVTHNDEPVPRIEVAVEQQSATTTVTVADNGPGVPDDQKEAIFGKGELGLESPGSGIGLYLVHSLVTAYQGRVWVEDNDPKGAIFTVELETAEE